MKEDWLIVEKKEAILEVYMTPKGSDRHQQTD